MSKYFETITEMKGALAVALPGVVVDVRSIHSGRLGGVRTMVFVGWVDGPRRCDVAAVVEPFRAALAEMSAELVCVREFSAWARSIIAPGPARLPGDFWIRAAVQDFDLRPIVDLMAYLENSRREVRISARVRALAAA